MSINRTFKRAVGGAIILLAAGAAATQATGDTAPQPTRAEAILAATQVELSDTQHQVSQIQLEDVVDGREIYALSGTGTSCILVAGVEQPAGRSRSLACTNADLAQPERPLRTGFELASGRGYVDLVSVDGNAPSQVVASGAAADVRRGARVVVAVREDDTRSSALRWQAPAGGTVTVPLPSRDERAAVTAAAE